MKNKHYIPTLVIVIGAWLIIAIICVIKPANDFSVSERRKLSAKPELSLEAVLNGSFMSDFEKYTLDQFPLRDNFRELKSTVNYYVFLQKDNNDIYIKNDYAAKLEYPLNEISVTNAAKKFTLIYDKYIKDSDAKVYMTVVPDKSYYLAADGSHPTMDYEKLFKIMKENMSYAQYIDIVDTLNIESYYKTDTHWRQEKIVETANKIANTLDIKIEKNYTEIKGDVPFYGVYYGQAALPMMSGEPINYLTNDIINAMQVYNVETGKTTGVYDMEKMHGRDPYELFLSGATPILYIENKNAETDRELVIFRDSFGSSIAPLISEGYARVTVIDTRYIESSFLGDFIKFDNQDVLFLYSTLILNNSNSIK